MIDLPSFVLGLAVGSALASIFNFVLLPWLGSIGYLRRGRP